MLYKMFYPAMRSEDLLLVCEWCFIIYLFKDAFLNRDCLYFRAIEYSLSANNHVLNAKKLTNYPDHCVFSSSISILILLVKILLNLFSIFSIVFSSFNRY